MDLTIICIGKPSFHREKTMDFTIIEKGFNHQTDRKTIRKIVQKSIDRLGDQQFSQEASRGSTHSYMGNAYPLDIQLDIQLASTQWKTRQDESCSSHKKIAYAMIKGWLHPRYIHCCWFHPIPYAYHPHISLLICIPITCFPIFIPYCPWIIGYNYIYTLYI